MFEFSSKNVRKILFIITYAIILCIALLNLDVVFNIFGYIYLKNRDDKFIKNFIIKNKESTRFPPQFYVIFYQFFPYCQCFFCI